MRDDQLAAKPFHLDRAAIGWVRTTLGGLTADDKIRQLFNLRSAGDNPDWIAGRAYRGRMRPPNARSLRGSTGRRRRRSWCRPTSRAAG